MPPKTASSCTAFSKDSIASLADVLRNGSRPTAGHSLDGCAAHAELQHQIHRDLKRWRDTPISEATMRRAIDDPAFTLTVAVHDGRVHVVRKSGDPKTTRSALLRDYAHFQREFYVYLRELLELEAAGAIPLHASAELVLAVNDEVLAHDYCAGAACPAIGRYTTKRDRAAGTGSPEVIVPGWDYAYWNFDVRFHSLIDEYARRFPWQQRCDKLFGRYSPYATYVARREMGSANVTTRHTRRHFVDVVGKLLGPSADLAVSKGDGGKVAMESWAHYRYVASLNGKAVSNSIQQLLTLGSTLFIEDNGYTTWFSAALRPRVHYVPIWEAEGHPDDAVAALEWARADEGRAAGIAAAGAAFAKTHLGPEGRRCYWHALWKGLSKAQPYFDEAVKAGRRELVPAAEFLADVVDRRLEGRADGAFGCHTLRCLVGTCTDTCAGSIAGWDYGDRERVRRCAVPCYVTAGRAKF